MMTMNSSLVPETMFREKVRCGEVYRNLNGNQMFQKFYYRCLECSMDFESGPDFEEHVIGHYLQGDDDDKNAMPISTTANSENVIDISSEDDVDEDNAYLYAVEVTSLVEENISENDLPLPLMQMLGQQQQVANCDEAMPAEDVSSDDGDDVTAVTFACNGLRNQALHQYSEPENCCTECPAYFSTKHESEVHRLIHTLPHVVECPHCSEVFPNAFKLNEHIRTRRKKHRTSIQNNGATTVSHHKKAKNQNSTSTQIVDTIDLEANNEANHCIEKNTVKPDRNNEGPVGKTKKTQVYGEVAASQSRVNASNSEANNDTGSCIVESTTSPDLNRKCDAKTIEQTTQ